MSVDLEIDLALAWCEQIIGPFQLLSDTSQAHAGQRASTYRLAAPQGNCFLKLHRDSSHWHQEVHAYETWVAAFESHAPRLLAAQEESPKALLTSELRGVRIDQADLTPRQAQAAWHGAGCALVKLHDYAQGGFFGPCLRDGSPAKPIFSDPVGYLTLEFDDFAARGLRGGWIDSDIQKTVDQVRQLIPAFTNEQPTPCHRDYCPPNWLVFDHTWSGVIDFEFSYWDVRAADLARFPDWDWMKNPGAYEAFLDGYYNHAPSLNENQQRLAAQALYALSALVWGMENQYFIFAREASEALHWLRPQITAALA